MNIKIQLFLLSLTIISISSKDLNDEYTNGLRFSSIQCKVNEYVGVLDFCYLKHISNRVVSLNAGGTMHGEQDKPIYIQLILYFRYELTYWVLIETKKLEWCSVMDRAAVLFSLGSEFIVKGVSHLFHKCPYSGPIHVENLTISDEVATEIYPEGYYMLTIIMSNKTDELFWVNVTAENKSPLKWKIKKF